MNKTLCNIKNQQILNRIKMFFIIKNIKTKKEMNQNIITTII